jgi:RNA polymerase sigma-70 factor (ECF subfamily)
VSSKWWGRPELPLAEHVRAALEQRVRAGHGRIVAALTRRFGVDRLSLVENAVQDAYVRALERWPDDGVPDQPERWLIRVAYNAAIDNLRHDAPMRPLQASHDLPVEPPSFERDDELRLMFLCCHPSLSRSAQIALMLNVAAGLTASQIARAFLSDERTVAQRIVRAKKQVRDVGVQFDVPDGETFVAGVAAILDVLYIVFSEGSHPTSDRSVDGLCVEALRLARILTEEERTATPAAFALRALLCFHSSREPARVGDDGSLLLLPEQDRSRWDHALMAEAYRCLDLAAQGREMSRFHIEAGIAACHAIAPSFAATDWVRIAELYEMLRACAPSLVVDVSRAIAIAMCSGARAGLDELDAIPKREILARYPYALAAYADLHASLGNLEEARKYLEQALHMQSSPMQQALLRRKRAALERGEPQLFGVDVK